jgi:site-specific recombinase XerD
MDFYSEKRKKNTLRLREILKQSPPFVREYFTGINDSTLPYTQVAYAYDLNIFFDYLIREKFIGKTLRELTLEDLSAVTATDIEEYMEYLSYYIRMRDIGGESKECELENQARAKARKLSSLKRMFSYF